MRIGIDVRYLSHGLVGGVHTYIAHFIPALIALATDAQIFLYADTKQPFELNALPPHVTLRLLPYRNALSSFVHDGFMYRHMATDRVEVAHFPANYGFGPNSARTVITLHDAINLLPLYEIIRGHPKNPRTLVTMTYLHICSTRAVRRAHLLLTVSAYAGREIAKYSHFDTQRIIPVSHAPTPDLRRITDESILHDVRTRHQLPAAFVLADALKNPATLVRAWRRLPPTLHMQRQIVFFSRRPDPLPSVFEAIREGYARLLVRPTRADLIALYSMADAFVFPSWIEGFGIPILEAMTCGAPVIASDRGALPEVVGEAGLLADAEDDVTFAQHLTRILSDADEAQHWRARGFARAAQFSWQKTAQSIWESYQHVLQPS